VKKLVYLIGEPGSGKTTLVQELFKGYEHNAVDVICPHIIHTSTEQRPAVIVELGKSRDEFGGTDALAMNIQPKALEFLRVCPHNLVIAEGDRLGNQKFFDAVTEMGWTLETVYLKPPKDISARRENRGSHYSLSWLKGRQTKIGNLLAKNTPWNLDGNSPVEELAGDLRGLINGGV